MSHFRIGQLHCILDILQAIYNATHVDGAEFGHKGRHIPTLYALGRSPGLRSPILRSPGSLLGLLLVLSLLDVSNAYKLAIWVVGNLLSASFDADFIDDNLLPFQLEFIMCPDQMECVKALDYLHKCYTDRV
jgi:hypothetical protein